MQRLCRQKTTGGGHRFPAKENDLADACRPVISLHIPVPCEHIYHQSTDVQFKRITMKAYLYTPLMAIVAMLLSAGSLPAQDAGPLAVRKAPALKSDRTPVDLLATEEEKMEVAEAIDHVLFDFDRATINPGAYAKLKGLAAWMKDKEVTLRVSGFADGIGTEEYNNQLSKRRAEAVKAYLVGNGATPGLIDPVGFGEANPVAGNNSSSGRSKNRRVEFALY